MASANEIEELTERFNDDYVQRVSVMKDGRIGGEVKRVMKIMRDPIMSHHSQDLPDKLIDGCLLKSATMLFEALDDDTMPRIAEYLEVDEDELTPALLTTLIDAQLVAIIVSEYGLKSHAEYIQKRGFEDLTLLVLGVGRAMVKQLPS